MNNPSNVAISTQPNNEQIMYNAASVKGLTLLELLITLSIIAIIASWAIPSFQAMQAKQEFSNLFYLIRQQINLARSHAVTTQRDIVICASSDLLRCQNDQWHQGILTFIDSNRNRKLDLNETIIATTPTLLKYGTLTWHGNASHPHQVVFQADSGLPRGSMGHFSYCNFNDVAYQQDFAIGMMGHLTTITSTQCQ